MPAPMIDVLEEHRDEAAFLRQRRARLDAMLEGDARHEHRLDARLDAHLDALHAAVDSASELVEPWIDSALAHERYVAVASLAPTERVDVLIERLTITPTVEHAVGDALVRYGAARGTPLLDRWLASGDARHQALALRVMAHWRDARTETIARRALRRDAPLVHRAAFAALARHGHRDVARYADALLADCAHADERDDVLRSLSMLDRNAALTHARRLLTEGAPCGATGLLLCGTAATDEDQATLGAWLARGPDAALMVAIAVSGCHAWLDAWWSDAHEADVSNALREASYALHGDDVPPRTLGPRAQEEPDERDARMRENALLQARMRTVAPGIGARWGARDRASLDVERARLGPRHRAWAAVVGGAQPSH